jgi:hypothetical protein
VTKTLTEYLVNYYPSDVKEFNISDSADNTNKNNQTSAPAAYNDYFAIPIQDEFDMKIKKLEDNIEITCLYIMIVYLSSQMVNL